MSENQLNKARARALAESMLKTPLSAPPPATIRGEGLMAPDRPNPARDTWTKQLMQRFRAFCFVEGIEPTESGAINWVILAYHLATKYEPTFKIRRKAGAKKKHDMPFAELDRRRLAELVAELRAKNPRLTKKGIAQKLARSKKLPELFKDMASETLRPHIARAEREAQQEHEFRETLARLFMPKADPKIPGLFGLEYSPFADKLSPADKAGEK